MSDPTRPCPSEKVIDPRGCVADGTRLVGVCGMGLVVTSCSVDYTEMSIHVLI